MHPTEEGPDRRMGTDDRAPKSQTDDWHDLRVELAKVSGELGGKLDTVVALMTGLSDGLKDHEHRIRDLEAQPVKDHEGRIRQLEIRPTISPRQLWAWVASAVAVGAVLVPLALRFAEVLQTQTP